MTARVLLGHGASGNAASMRPHVEGLRRRGIEAAAVELPRGTAERAIPAYQRQMGDDDARTVIGGHSFGGRVASMIATERGVAGLVLLSYPLHRPGATGELRVEHWPRIRCPVLLLSGESDPFARVDLLRAQVATQRGWTLHTYPGVQHGLLAVLDDALDRVAHFVRSLPG
jgi:predicted alpha/beta-hydrolase family hydrolase